MKPEKKLQTRVTKEIVNPSLAESLRNLSFQTDVVETRLLAGGFQNLDVSSDIAVFPHEPLISWTCNLPFYPSPLYFEVSWRKRYETDQTFLSVFNASGVFHTDALGWIWLHAVQSLLVEDPSTLIDLQRTLLMGLPYDDAEEPF